MKGSVGFVLKTVAPLMLIAVMVGFLLGLTYQWLEPKLAEAARREEQAALKALLPEAASFDKRELNGKVYYQALDATNGLMGLIVKTANTGYGGPVQAMVAVTNLAVK